MKRLGPILVILLGAVLTFGGLSSSTINAGVNVPTCGTLAPTAATFAEIIVVTTLPPCRPCDTIPIIGSLVPCETTTTIGATTTVATTVAPTVAPTTTESSGSGANLPATGSSGISVTLVMGVALMTLGVVLLLVRRRSPSAPAS